MLWGLLIRVNYDQNRTNANRVPGYPYYQEDAEERSGVSRDGAWAVGVWVWVLGLKLRGCLSGLNYTVCYTILLQCTA